MNKQNDPGGTAQDGENARIEGQAFDAFESPEWKLGWLKREGRFLRHKKALLLEAKREMDGETND